MGRARGSLPPAFQAAVPPPRRREMPTLHLYRRRATARDYLFFPPPRLWPLWPFLPVVRRPAGAAEPELGLMYDARGAAGRDGYSAAGVLTNYFLGPAAQADLPALPPRVYHTPHETAADGWTGDLPPPG